VAFAAIVGIASIGSFVGGVGETLRRFLETVLSSPYYQFKTYMALSRVDEENEPWENLAACTHFLEKTDEAMKVAKETYTHDPEDAKTLDNLIAVLQGEGEEMRERRQAVESSDDEYEE
jgi:Tfp pilus assembly protein PilF